MGARAPRDVAEGGRRTRVVGRFVSGDASYLLPDLEVCPWPRCWERPAGLAPAPALCPEHLGELRPGPGCGWPGCPQSPWEPGGFCFYHERLATGLIDPIAHNQARTDALASLPLR